MKQVSGSVEPFCETCGEKTIAACGRCNTPIRGQYFEPGVLYIPDKYIPPAFCYGCGVPFPWTERAIQAAIELATESGDLNEQEQQQFAESVHEISKNTPKAQVAGSRIVRLLAKMGATARDAARDILVDVASETVKKIIWPDK